MPNKNNSWVSERTFIWLVNLQWNTFLFCNQSGQICYHHCVHTFPQCIGSHYYTASQYETGHINCRCWQNNTSSIQTYYSAYFHQKRCIYAIVESNYQILFQNNSGVHRCTHFFVITCVIKLLLLKTVLHWTEQVVIGEPRFRLLGE